MPVRIVLVLAAVAGVALGVVRLADQRACKRSVAEALAASFDADRGRDPRAVAVTRDLLARCRGAQELTPASEALGQGGQLEPSEQLARAAVEREPERWLSWLALATVLQRQGEPVPASRARDRALALNPRYGLTAPGGLLQPGPADGP